MRFLASFPEAQAYHLTILSSEKRCLINKGSIAPGPLRTQLSCVHSSTWVPRPGRFSWVLGDRRASTPTSSFRCFAWQLAGLVHDASRCWFEDSDVGHASDPTGLQPDSRALKLEALNPKGHKLIVELAKET